MKRLYTILFSLSLILFTGYFLCDTFLLTNSYVVVNDDKIKEEPMTKKEDKIIFTDEQYKDKNIEINISKTKKFDTKIYIADIKIKNIEYLKTAFAKDTYGKNIASYTSKIAKSKNAILAINGDFYGVQQKGYVLKNSKVYRSAKNNSKQDLIIKNDGTFDFIKEKKTDIDSLVDVKELLSFGPALIDENKIVVNKNSKVQREKTSNPRTAIAMIEPMHYIFLVSDGRTSKSKGLSLYELAKVLEDYDVKYAYNLDGGGSSAMYFNGRIVNNPINKHKLVERKVSDIVYIGY